MKTTALRLAEHIIYLAKENDKSITNLVLMGVLYHLWVEYYRNYEEYLFVDSFFAWQIGPTVPHVYYKYCIYAANDLQCFSNFKEAPIFDAELRARIDQIIIGLLSMSVYQLFAMSTNSEAWKERREIDAKYHSDGEMAFARIIALDVREGE